MLENLKQFAITKEQQTTVFGGTTGGGGNDGGDDLTDNCDPNVEVC